MAQDTMFMQQIAMGALLGADFCFPATVLKFDEINYTADIQPLFMRKEVGQEPEAPTIVEDVPINYFPLKVGDGPSQNYKMMLKRGMVVQCVVNQRAMDEADTRKPYAPGRSRILNQHDAVIVGVLY